MGTLLVDGHFVATWKLTPEALVIKPFTKLPTRDVEATTKEATRLVHFITDTPHEVTFMRDRD
jgi:hypothetical protein